MIYFYSQKMQNPMKDYSLNCKSQGIMLSENKMVIGQTSIEFLGVNISNGKYTLQLHIAATLGKFPDELTSAK